MHSVGPGVWWKNEKRGTWDTHTIDYRIWRETMKNLKNNKYTLEDLEYGEKHWKKFTMRKTHCRTWNLAKNSEEWEKWEIDTLGLEFGEKNWKTWKLRYTHFRTRNMEENHWKTWKMRNTHCRTWNVLKKQRKKPWKMSQNHCITWNMSRNTE